MRVISFVQKPYDVLINLEYLYTNDINRTALTAVIIGHHSNAVLARQLCADYRISYVIAPDPDLYAVTVAKLTARFSKWRRATIAAKALLLVPAYFYWFYAFYAARRYMKAMRADLILSDAWRSKCIYWAHLPEGTPTVLHDGGYSTLHYGLLPAYGKGGAQALVSQSLHKQRPLLPGVLRKALVKHTPKMAQFFTSYTPLSTDCASFEVTTNTYALSRHLFQQKESLGMAMILGIPSLKHVDLYLAKALDELTHADLPATPDNVEYRFHPTDLNRSNLDANYRQRNEEGVAARGMKFSYPIYSLEIDFLKFDALPRIIICYESSGLSWIRAVVGDAIKIVVLSER